MLSSPFLLALAAAAILVGVFLTQQGSVSAVEMTQERCAAQGGTWKNIATIGGVPEMGCVGGAVIKGMTLEEQVTFATKLTAASGCVSDHMKGSFVMGDGTRASGYDWPIAPFDDGTGRTLVNKQSSCVNLFLDMVEAAGYGYQYGEVFDKIGYTFKGHQDDGDHYDGNPSPKDRASAFYNLILSRVGSKGFSGPACGDSSTDPSSCTPPTGAMKYLIAWKALNAGTCKFTQDGPYFAASDVRKEQIKKPTRFIHDGKSTIYVKVPILDTSDTDKRGTLEDYVYKVAYGGENDEKPTTKQRTYGDFEPTCVSLTNDLNKYAKAYAAYMKMHPAEIKGAQSTPTTDDPSKAADAGETKSSCNIDGIGWILCPVLSAGANLADSAFGFLADNFLQVSTGLLGVDPNTVVVDSNGTQVKVGNGTYIAWGIMRNIANVAFVIVFLFIIFSQLSNVGVSNYGVKKMLPRLIVGAILVNISFFVCQAAVDISNIVGYGAKELLGGVANQIAQAGVGGIDTSMKGDQSSHLAGILTTVIVGGAVVWMNLGAIGLAIIAGVVVLLTVFVLLVVRQALVVLLIVVSPLAFVAFLLPNTEGLFKRWRKMLVAMLLLFPIVGLLFGASQLASSVLLQSAGKNVPLQVAAYMALVVPLIAIVPLLKGALASAPALGNAIQNMGKRSSSLAQGGAKRGAAAYKNSGFGKFRQAKRADRKARIAAGTYTGVGGNLNPRNLRSRANAALNDSHAFNVATGGFGAQRDLAAQAQNRADQKEAIAMFGGDDALVQAWAASGGDDEHAAFGTLDGAQQKQFMKMRDAGHHRKATSHLATAQYLSENGKGSAADVQNALAHATAAGASATDTDGAMQAAIAGYRKSGRGDVLAQLQSAVNVAQGRPPMTMQEGWSQVGPSAVHREGIDATKNPAGRAAYEAHLQSDAEHTRQALVGFDSMEQRARVQAESAIVAAAQLHQYNETGVAPTITGVKDARAYFKIR